MKVNKIIRQFPIPSYFILTFFLSWLGAFILVAPKLLSGQIISKMDGILMFPVMLIGPSAASIVLTAITDGKTGLRNLFSRMGKWKLSIYWYAIALLIPPCLILLILFLFRSFVSPSFNPNWWPVGFLFGVPAGFFEEIGWTGFAIHKMLPSKNRITTGIIIGFLWGLWHLPVIDFLGSASPHGVFLIPFILSFIALLMAVRLLIVWVYSFTKSILIAQIIHAVSTGCLAMLGPSKVTPAQETLWYGSYAVLLWITVLTIYFIDNRKRAKVKKVDLQ